MAARGEGRLRVLGWDSLCLHQLVPCRGINISAPPDIGRDGREGKGAERATLA